MGHLFDNLAQLEEETTARKKACRVALVAEEVRVAEGDEAAEKLLALITNPSVAMDPLCGVIRSSGYALGRESLRRHRAQVCPCEFP